MTAVAGLGTVLSEFLPVRISEFMNLVIGAVIFWLGMKMLVRKEVRK